VKKGRSSKTALYVTFARALAHGGITNVVGFVDPTARPMLDPSWLRRLENVERREHRGAMFEISKRMADLMALRTMNIDAHVRAAIERGVRQLVILGAGLDGRAFRMHELEQVDVFEVDHPDTQAIKRERVASLAPDARSVHFVALDFERGSLGAALEQAGHRAGEPTIWVWEGVVMYLTDEAVRTTLAAVAARSAPTSALVIQYNTPEGTDAFSKFVLWLWGEPHVGLRTPEQMASALTAAGFQPSDDSGASDWAARFGSPAPSGNSARRARIVVGRR
jgi:methyltransferase (TIGR00027 family)